MFGKTILKWAMLGLNLAAVFCVLMTLSGSVISPVKILLPAYFALIFPWIIILNVGFTLFWLILRKWYFLFSLSTLIISSIQVNETIPIHFGKMVSESANHSIGILTYNTMMLGKMEKNTRKNPNKVIQYVLAKNADIVCLQEFMVNRNKKYLTHSDAMKAFSNYKYKDICYVREERSKIYGIATLSKFPIINRQRIYYDSYANASIYTDILVDGDTLRIFNNHLESNRLTEGEKTISTNLKDNLTSDNITGLTLHFTHKLGLAYKLRAAQADIVSQEIQDSPYKTIVCGDFNDVPASYVYTKMKGSLSDAFEETGTGIGWTYYPGIYKFRIDYILYDSTNFKPIKYVSDKVNFSDHYPVYCQLQIK